MVPRTATCACRVRNKISGTLIHALRLKLWHFKVFPCLYREAMHLQCYSPICATWGAWLGTHITWRPLWDVIKIALLMPACFLGVYLLSRQFFLLSLFALNYTSSSYTSVNLGTTEICGGPSPYSSGHPYVCIVQALLITYYKLTRSNMIYFFHKKTKMNIVTLPSALFRLKHKINLF